MTQDRFYWPDPLYRVLPFLYIAAGVIVPLYVSSTITLFSGALLVAAGLLVIMWRLSARTRRRRLARQRAARRAAEMDSISPRISSNGEMRWE